MTPSEILKEGKLSEAISATNEAVKSAPKDLQHRWFLAELLVIAGDLDRADKQLDTLLTLDPRTAVAATPIRQLIRAEAARRQFFDEGRVPEFLDGIHEAAKVRLEAFVALRAGDKSLAGSLVEKAEVARPSLSGKITLQGSQSSFEDIRDLDDITADVFEVLTYTGKYYWIEMSRVQLIEFVAPERPLDLIWRKARMVMPRCTCRRSTAHRQVQMMHPGLDVKPTGLAWIPRPWSVLAVGALLSMVRTKSTSWLSRRWSFSPQPLCCPLNSIALALNDSLPK